MSYSNEWMEQPVQPNQMANTQSVLNLLMDLARDDYAICSILTSYHSGQIDLPGLLAAATAILAMQRSELQKIAFSALAAATTPQVYKLSNTHCSKEQIEEVLRSSGSLKGMVLEEVEDIQVKPNQRDRDQIADLILRDSDGNDLFVKSPLSSLVDGSMMSIVVGSHLMARQKNYKVTIKIEEM